MCAATRLGVGVGAGTLKFLLLMEKHLNPQSGHHKRHNGYGYSQHYQYSFSHLGKQKSSLSAPISLLPLKDWALSFLHWIIESIFIVNNWFYAFLLFFFGIFFLSKSIRFQKNGHIIHFVDCFCNQIAKVHFFSILANFIFKKTKNDVFFLSHPASLLMLALTICPVPSHRTLKGSQSWLTDRKTTIYDCWLHSNARHWSNVW